MKKWRGRERPGQYLGPAANDLLGLLRQVGEMEHDETAIVDVLLVRARGGGV